MAGLRVGWVACQNQASLKKIEQMKHYTSICNSAPSEMLNLIALDNKETILKRNNLIIEENLKILDQFFQIYKHKFPWVRPAKGCVGFVLYRDSQSIDSFSHKLLESLSSCYLAQHMTWQATISVLVLAVGICVMPLKG